jgi:hypothetical protein
MAKHEHLAASSVTGGIYSYGTAVERICIPEPQLGRTSQDSLVRYVGKSAARDSPQFAYRFGLLLIGLAGYGDQTWIAQNAYDLLSYVGWENPIINPLDFYCAWRTDYQCPSCAEVQLYSFFCRTV